MSCTPRHLTVPAPRDTRGAGAARADQQRFAELMAARRTAAAPKVSTLPIEYRTLTPLR